MKKYLIPSFLFVFFFTVMCGFLIPLLLAFLPFPEAMPVYRIPQDEGSRQRYFLASHEGRFLLVSQAKKQVPRIAEVRALPVDLLYNLIDRDTTSWVWNIFPTYVAIEQLNSDLDRIPIKECDEEDE